MRLDKQRLQQLCQRVAEQLIPELRALGDRLVAEPLESWDDAELANCIEARQALLDRWKRVYWDEFIPFAHGVRYLGLYYNDAVHPQDPYDFVGLLRGEDRLASQRNVRPQQQAVADHRGAAAKDAAVGQVVEGQRFERRLPNYHAIPRCGSTDGRTGGKVGL